MGRFGAKPDIANNNLVLDLDPSKPGSLHTQLPSTVQVLVVAGGGAGGANLGGGGGAGGVVYNTNFAINSQVPITVTIGAGGTGVSGGQGGTVSNDGNNSIFSTITAIGGGGAGSGTANYNGRSGGSGGGASGYSTNNPGGSGTTNQGSPGGYGGGGSPYYGGGGGGGAGKPGDSGVDGVQATAAGDGGHGKRVPILGTMYYFGGGGGGGVYYNSDAGNGGLGGGGGGGSMTGGYNGQGGGSAINTGNNGGALNDYLNSTFQGGGHAGANTGGGGGGAQHQRPIAGNGGSGIVIVRYPGPQAATGGTITSHDGHTIHTFTSSGTFTPNGLGDLSNNGNHFDLINGVKHHSTEGGYLEFDGVNDTVSRNDVTYKTGGGWTVESLVYYNFVADGYNNSSSPANFISSNGAAYNSWYWSVLSKKLALWNINPGYWKYGSTTLQPYTWYHAVLVCNDAGDTYQMYLNGIAEGGTHVDNAGSWNTERAGLKIAHIGSGNGSIRFLNGKMAFTRAYDKAFTEEEVVEAYNRIDRSRGLQKVASKGLGSVSNPASSAQQLHDNGINENGVYYIDTGAGVVPTYCEFKNGEGWMLVMNIKSDYFGDSKLTWNDYNNWINAGEDLGNTSSPFTCNGQYRNSSIFNNMPNEKWMIKVHNYGKEYGNGSWAAWQLLTPGPTFVNIMNTTGRGSGGTQITDRYYVAHGLGESGYAQGLQFCPIARTLGHLRVNHLLNNNGARILGSEQFLEGSNTDRTRGISTHYAISGTALDNTQNQWNAHISPYVNVANTAPYGSSLRQFTELQFPDGSNINTSTQGEIVLADGIYPHYGIFVK